MTEDNKCPCEELEKNLSRTSSATLPETLRALTDLVNAICNCGCGNGPGTGDGDGDGPGVGDEYLLDLDITSNEGINGYVPFASSSFTSPTSYATWRPFQKSTVEIGDYHDCWFSNGAPKENNPEYLGLTMGDRTYVVTRVEFITRNHGSIVQAPESINLEYLNENDEWRELTEREVNLVNTPKTMFEINVPADRQVALKGIRLMIYSSYDDGNTSRGQSAVLARMRIWVKDLA